MTHPDPTATVRIVAGLDVDYAVPEHERCQWAGCDTTAAVTEHRGVPPLVWDHPPSPSPASCSRTPPRCVTQAGGPQQMVMLSSADFAKACGQVDDRVRDGGLWHGNQPPLNAAVTAARWRSAGTGGERAWQLKDAPGIAPLAAVTRAVAGLVTARPSAPPPLSLPATDRAADGYGGVLGGLSVHDVAQMGF